VTNVTLGFDVCHYLLLGKISLRNNDFVPVCELWWDNRVGSDSALTDALAAKKTPACSLDFGDVLEVLVPLLQAIPVGAHQRNDQTD